MVWVGYGVTKTNLVSWFESATAPGPTNPTRWRSWGSCSPQGRITLNVKLIKVPQSYIDYVIFHELCHLAEPHHSSQYYELLDRVLPDWRERREKLNSFEFG
jgi:predicted SprT family Zn-dependent metalloprotease